jgi:hypothetical protein
MKRRKERKEAGCAATQTCNPSYSGDGGRRVEFKASLGKVSKTLSQKQNKTS